MQMLAKGNPSVSPQASLTSILTRLMQHTIAGLQKELEEAKGKAVQAESEHASALKDAQEKLAEAESKKVEAEGKLKEAEGKKTEAEQLAQLHDKTAKARLPALPGV